MPAASVRTTPSPIEARVTWASSFSLASASSASLRSISAAARAAKILRMEMRRHVLVHRLGAHHRHVPQGPVGAVEQRHGDVALDGRLAQPGVARGRGARCPPGRSTTCRPRTTFSQGVPAEVVLEGLAVAVAGPRKRGGAARSSGSSSTSETKAYSMPRASARWRTRERRKSVPVVEEVPSTMARSRSSPSLRWVMSTAVARAADPPSASPMTAEVTSTHRSRPSLVRMRAS